MSHRVQTTFLLLLAIGFIVIGIWSSMHMRQDSEELAPATFIENEVLPSPTSVLSLSSPEPTVAPQAQSATVERVPSRLVQFLLETLGIAP